MAHQDDSHSSEPKHHRPLLLVLGVGLVIAICGVVYSLFLDPPGGEVENDPPTAVLPAQDRR